MKQLILVLTLIIPTFSNGQDYKLPNENILFEFNTTNGKRLVIAIDSSEEYMVYRYGSVENIELEFPENFLSSWDEFQYSWYLRGGGVENEGLDLDYLYFSRGNYRYVIYSEYYSRAKTTEYGIKVINLKTNKKTIIKADPKTVKGSLAVFRDMDKIKKGEELFD